MNRIWLIVFGDFASFLISFLLLLLIRFNGKDYLHAVNIHLLPFTILYLSWVLIFYIFGLYDLFSIKPTIPYFKRWAIALLCSFGVGIILFYFVPIFGISPKLNLVIEIIFFGFFSFLFRRMLYTLFAKAITQPAIFIGDSFYLTELEKIISKNPQIGLQVLNHFRNISEVILDLKNTKNLVIILDKQTDGPDKIILSFYKQGAEIIDTAKAYEKYLYKIPIAYIDLSFILENVNIRKDIFYKLATFIINIIFSLTILIVTSPFLIISAIFIYLHDRGPIIYKQQRVGLNGKIFELYKLRSMKIDAESNGAVWADKKDCRVTPVGKIIRSLHIDEIPQMINILKGDIALVGPRPERPEFVTMLEKTIPHYEIRHIIRPGFTGWAQIKYRYANTVEASKEKFEYDLYYIKNKNIFIDFGIIIRTIQIIFTH